MKYTYGEPMWTFDKSGHRTKPDGTSGCECWYHNEGGSSSYRRACPECHGEDIYGTEQLAGDSSFRMFLSKTGGGEMGCFDTIMIPCPKCGEREEAQTKSGECLLDVYQVEVAPVKVLIGVNTHAPFTCRQCGTVFKIKFQVTTKAWTVECDDDS